MRVALFQRVTEESINPVEGNCAASDHRAGCHCPPQRVGAGKFPDGEQRRHHGHQDARACCPEGNSSDQVRIQKASFRPALSRALQMVLHAMSYLNSSSPASDEFYSLQNCTLSSNTALQPVSTSSIPLFLHCFSCQLMASATKLVGMPSQNPDVGRLDFKHS